MLRDIHLFLHTLENVVGLKTWRTGDKKETVDWIMSLHQWWTVKEWEEHHGHQQPHTDLSPAFVKASFEKRVAAQLAGVGWVRAKAIADTGMSVREMVEMYPEDWRKIEGIGDVLSESIYGEFRGAK
jgi:ERCC4-type nuclease